MSVKRQATTELNHDNWDQDDPSEHEEMGMFKTASKDVLERRVIRTAKRRTHTQSGDEAKKSVFSGFGGFNKTQPSSFDFLANLTNGNKTTNGTASNKAETPVSSGLFSSKPVASSPGPGLFGTPVTSSPGAEAIFGKPTASSSLFGGATTTSVQTPFSMSKTEKSATDSPFKIPTSSSTNNGSNDGFKSTTANSSFGTSFAANKSPFSTSSSNTTPFQASSTHGVSKMSSKNDTEKKVEVQNDDKKMNYYAKLKGLNESVSDWIKKHVEETPLCILTPIFKDYEKHLKEIQDEYTSGEKDSKQSSENASPEDKPSIKNTGTSLFSSSNSKSSPFGNHSNSPNEKHSEPAASASFSFGVNAKQNTTPNEKPTEAASAGGFSFGVNAKQSTNEKAKEAAASVGFSFGVNAKQSTNEKAKEAAASVGFSFGVNAKQNTSSNSTTSSGGFSFGINSTPQTTTATSSSLFSLAPSSGSNGPTAAPFSFSSDKPFSFGSNIAIKPAESANANAENEDEDQPPKVEFTPVVEENSVFDKKCKIFVKKDGNFADKGVGTLYIKKIEETGKHQLLVRANTSLGNVLLNLILASSIPTQRLGKNNVMLVCIPTPDAKPPPTPVLIRVKTSEEADALLETLNKYKV